MKLDPQPEDLPITVSVRGDTNVKFTAESAFTFQKGSKWSDVKARIEKKITYSEGSLLSSDTERVLRGGNWSENDEKAIYGCMTGKRDNDSSDRSYDVVGFRLVWKEE